MGVDTPELSDDTAPPPTVSNGVRVVASTQLYHMYAEVLLKVLVTKLASSSYVLPAVKVKALFENDIVLLDATTV
jgi:hypothetical protein